MLVENTDVKIYVKGKPEANQNDRDAYRYAVHYKDKHGEEDE